MERIKLKVGDCFFASSGANSYGSGMQIAIVHKVTSRGNAYCYKFSIRKQGKPVALNHRITEQEIIEPIPVQFPDSYIVLNFSGDKPQIDWALWNRFLSKDPYLEKPARLKITK